MCGLWGALGSSIWKNNVESVDILATLSQYRGRHSTGVIYGEAGYGINKNKRKYHILKEAVPSPAFLESEAYKSLWPKVQSLQVVVGHCRHATIGDVNEDNAHPFNINNHILGVHNGTMPSFNIAKNNLTDSENFYRELEANDGSLVKVFDKLGDNDAYAFVWINVKENTLHMIRNTARTLYIMKQTPLATDKGKHRILYWASEAMMLLFMSSRSDVSFEKPELIEPGIEHVWDIGDASDCLKIRHFKNDPAEVITHKDTKRGHLVPVGNKPKEEIIATGGSSVPAVVPFKPDNPVVPSEKGKQQLTLPMLENKEMGIRYYKATTLFPQASAILPKFASRNRTRYVLRYRAYNNALLTYDEAEELLKDGNIDNTWQIITPRDPVFWVSSNQYIPDNKLTDKFYLESFQNMGAFKGELIYVVEQDYQNFMLKASKSNQQQARIH